MAIVRKHSHAHDPEREYKWDSAKVLRAVANDVQNWRRNLLAIPGTNTFMPWEADLLVVSRSKFLTEVEIKISMSDWKDDLKKSKWAIEWKRTKYFWYAAPLDLAERYKELCLPDWVGVYGVTTPPEPYNYGRTEIVRQAKQRLNFRKLTDQECFNLARLGALRIWT